MNPHLPDEIVPGLWLGSRHVRVENEEFMNSSVTHVVDASNMQIMPTLQPTISVFTVKLTDSADSLLPFDEVSTFIDTALTEEPSSISSSASASTITEDEGMAETTRSNDAGHINNNNRNVVFVHCNQGMSRSPALVMAYLMQVKGFTLEQAFFHIKDKRRMTLPNVGFMKQLIELERTVHEGETTLKLGCGGILQWTK